MKKNNLKRQVYFNGDFVDENEARISIYDSALMFGDRFSQQIASANGKKSLKSFEIYCRNKEKRIATKKAAAAATARTIKTAKNKIQNINTQ